MNDQTEDENFTIEPIEEIELKQPYVIDKNDLSKKRNKQYDLISNENANNRFLLRKKWYEFNFDKAIYCKKITFFSHNDDISGLIIVVFDSLGREKETKITTKDSGNIYITIDRVITGFKIKPSFRLIKEKIELNKIVINGYHESDFKEIEKKVSDYLAINKRIEERTTKLNGLVTKVEKSIEEKQEIESDLEENIKSLSEISGEFHISIDGLKNEEANLSEKLNDAKKSLETTNKNIKLAENNVEQLSYESKQLNETISREERKLNDLVNNKNLFAYEVEDYIKQGNRNIQSYTVLSFIPWLLIGYVTWYLFNGAVELSNIINKHENVDMLNLLISRIPFVLIASAVIITSYELSKVFVTKIIEINTQKLRFSELGIISKDVSIASTNGLDLTDDEVFEVRTRLKMDLLRHHLKKLDPERFEYEINPSLWNKYTKLLKEKFTKNEIIEIDEQVKSSTVQKLGK